MTIRVNVAAINRITIITAITLVQVAITGAMIFAWIYNTSPYTATVGFAVYFILAAILAIWRIERVTTYEVTLDELHTMLASLDYRLTDIENSISELVEERIEQ